MAPEQVSPSVKSIMEIKDTTFQMDDEQKLDLLQRFAILRNRLTVQTSNPTIAMVFDIKLF